MAKEQLFRSYLSSALFLVQQYTGKTPFSLFLKEYFGVNKKYGSRDRKYITGLCYCYYRSGHALKTAEPEKKMLSSLFLCLTKSNELLQNLHPPWNEKVTLSLEKKISLLHPEFVVQDIFPWADEISEGIDMPAFSVSHLIQPSLFLRIRPGYRKAVHSKLISHHVMFEEINEDCLALPNASKIDTVIELDKEAVVQDYSSQQTGEFIKSEITNRKSEISFWDCCAGSGGKSIMVHDLNPEIELTASDVRESILINLKKRFKRAGITKYKYFVKDLAVENSPALPLGSGEGFNVIIADVPCSGSGTWSRTPEQLYFFEKKKINEYALLQKKILANVIPSLQAGGWLLYSTCSVFKKENEDAVEFLQQNFQLQLIKMGLLKGYDKKADTLFAALLKKQL